MDIFLHTLYLLKTCLKRKKEANPDFKVFWGEKMQHRANSRNYLIPQWMYSKRLLLLIRNLYFKVLNYLIVKFLIEL